MNIEGREFRFVRGSDVQRDGMYIEVTEVVDGPERPVAEVFYSDETHKITSSAFMPDVPFEVIESLTKTARDQLTPIGRLGSIDS